MKNELEKTEHSVIELNSTTSQLHSSTLAIGMILDGKYEIIKEIARGGMGIVYEAYHKIFKRKVAIKIILSSKIDSLQLRRFQKEVLACVNLSHPNVIKIYDAGIYNNNPYIVMEYINGVDICQYVAQHDPNYGKEKLYKTGLGIKRDWKLCVQLIYKTALALEYIHKQKMLHRDIKPSNILVRPDGTPIIIDLGLIKFQSEKVESLTKSGELLGTLQYMPIEQAQGKHGGIDARSDIYSLGLVLYELLTEEMAYSGTNLMEICYNIMSYIPPLPREINPQIPEVLEKITIHATEKQKEKRYATAQEFADALKKYLDDENVQETKQKKYDDYKKQVRLQRNKKRIIKYCIALVMVIITTIAIITNRNYEIRQREQQISQLKQQISQSEQQINEKQEQYNKLMDGIKIKNNKLNAYKQQRNALETKQTTLTQDLKTLDNELSKYNQQHNELEKQQKILIQKIENPQSEIRKLSEQKDSLQKQSQELEAQINELKESASSYKKYKNQLEKIKKTIETTKQDIKKAQNEKSQLENELSSMPSEIQKLKAEISSLEIEVQNQKADEVPSSSIHISYSKLYYELKNSLKEKESELRKAENRKKRLPSSIGRTLKRIKDLEQKRDNQQKQYDELKRGQNANQSLEKKQKELENTKTKIENLDKCIKDNESSLNEKLKQVKDALLKCKENHDSLQIKNNESSLHENLKKIKDELLKCKENHDSLQKDINDENANARQLDQQLNNIQRQKKKLEKQLEQLKYLQKK